MPKQYVSRSFEIKAIKALVAYKKKHKFSTLSETISRLIEVAKTYDVQTGTHNLISRANDKT